MSDAVLERIRACGIVPAVTFEDEELAVPVAGALLKGGIDVIEVTFRTPAAEACIRRIAEAYPDMLVGAGTVLAADQVDCAREAGAVFGVSPGINPLVVKRAAEAGLVFAPGVATPTEIEQGLALGCRLLKFFPAEKMGGVATLNTIAGPYGHTGVRFLPTGGIHTANMLDYLNHRMVTAIGGSWVSPADLIKERKWSEISRLAREARGLANSRES